MYLRASEAPSSLSEQPSIPELPPSAQLHTKEPADQTLALAGGQLLSVLLMLMSLATASGAGRPLNVQTSWLAGVICLASYALWTLCLLKNTFWSTRTDAAGTPGHRLLLGMSLAFGVVWGAMALLTFSAGSAHSLGALTWTLLISLLLSSHYHTHGTLRQPAWMLLSIQCLTLISIWLLREDPKDGEVASAALLTTLLIGYAISRLRAREHAEVQRNVNERLEEKSCLMQQIAHLQDAHNAKSRLLAMVSHDLRQPVHALGLMLGRFRQDTSSSALRIEIEAVNDVVNSLSKSLTMMMAVTRLNADQVIALPESVSLDRLFRSLSNEFEATATAHHLQLVFQANGLSVTTDPNHLRTILANLISNAIKYTPQGGVQVAARRTDRSLVSIEVRDSGIGIPTHELSRIFDPFVRLHFRKASVDGIGLGLAIVKQTADLIQAPMHVDSTLGTGTTFTIELPLSQQVHTPGAALPNTQLRGLRVVVVDNDETVLESMARTLEEWGCRVIAASAWDELEVKLGMTVSPIDLILTDFHLDAGFSGYELITRLRKRHRAQIPAILLTGDVEIRHGPESTATAVVIAYKPLPRDKLALLIYETVSSHTSG